MTHVRRMTQEVIVPLMNSDDTFRAAVLGCGAALYSHILSIGGRKDGHAAAKARADALQFNAMGLRSVNLALATPTGVDTLRMLGSILALLAFTVRE